MFGFIWCVAPSAEKQEESVSLDGFLGDEDQEPASNVEYAEDAQSETYGKQDHVEDDESLLESHVAVVAQPQVEYLGHKSREVRGVQKYVQRDCCQVSDTQHEQPGPHVFVLSCFGSFLFIWEAFATSIVFVLIFFAFLAAFERVEAVV